MNFFNKLGHDFQHMGGSINNVFHPQHGQPQTHPILFTHTTQPSHQPVTKPPVFHGGYIVKSPISQIVNTHISNSDHTNQPVRVDTISGNDPVVKTSVKDSKGLFPPAQSFVIPVIVGAVIMSVLLK